MPLITPETHCEGYVQTATNEVACAQWKDSLKAPVPMFFDHIVDFHHIFDLPEDGEYLEGDCHLGGYYKMDFSDWRELMIQNGSCIWIEKHGIRRPKLLTIADPIPDDPDTLLVNMEEVRWVQTGENGQIPTIEPL